MFSFFLNSNCSALSLFIILLYQGNPFWKLVRNLLKKPNQEQIDCQHPKPILLDTGEMKEPYDWAVGTQFQPILFGKCCKNCRNPVLVG